MPHIDGADFVRAVRNPPFSFSGLVVMVTTETDRAHVVLALDAGVDEYVMKPFTKDVVLSKLALLGVGV